MAAGVQRSRPRYRGAGPAPGRGVPPARLRNKRGGRVALLGLRGGGNAALRARPRGRANTAGAGHHRHPAELQVQEAGVARGGD
jgi:hypothetical protein